MKKCNFLVHLRDAKFGISEEKNLRSTCSRLFPTTVSNLTQLPFQAQEEVNMRAQSPPKLLSVIVFHQIFPRQACVFKHISLLWEIPDLAGLLSINRVFGVNVPFSYGVDTNIWISKESNVISMSPLMMNPSLNRQCIPLLSK